MAAGRGAPACRRGVRAYLRAAGLAYGALDFAEDGDGTWWFLECNQSGQFGFVEVDTGQPIARTIAEWLARPGAADAVEPGGPDAAAVG